MLHYFFIPDTIQGKTNDSERYKSRVDIPGNQNNVVSFRMVLYRSASIKTDFWPEYPSTLQNKCSFKFITYAL